MPDIKRQLDEAARLTPEVFPDPDAEAASKVADSAVSGVLLFYGHQAIKVGRRNIDWTGGQVNHQEWTAQLNRFLQLHALRRAYRQTKDMEYARCARDYIEDWIGQHEPYDMDNGQPPYRDSSLNMSIRLGGLLYPGWLGVTPDFLDSDAFDEAFVEKMLRAIDWQLDWLAVNLRDWGNWRIVALEALFCSAIRLPDRFSRHLRLAVEGLNTAFGDQILPDGTHVERSGGYHQWMCRLFIQLWKLGQRRGELNLSFDPDRVARMSAYSLHHLKPNGAMCGFNDCTGAYRTPDGPARPLAERMKQHQDFLAQLAQTHQPPDIPRFAVFSDAGHVFYRTGWGTDDTWWAFDAIGWSGGGHTHLSRLSVELHNGRRTTLPDPGIFDYEMSNPLAPVGKSTPAHSTMNVNLQNQANLEGRLIRALELPGAVVVQGSYEGSYWPGVFKWQFNDGLGKGSFGRHDRTVVWLKDRAMVVLDCMSHDAPDTAYLHWVSDDVPVTMDADSLGFTSGDTEGNVQVRVCPISDCSASGSIRRGRKDPYLGWVHSAGGVVAAPLYQVRFEHTARQGKPVDTECVTVIAPFAGLDAPRFTVSAKPADSVAREVTIQWADGSADRIIYTCRLAYAIRNCGDVHTDSPLVLIYQPAGGGDWRVERLGGNFLRIDQRQ